MTDIRKSREEHFKQARLEITRNSTPAENRQLDLLSEKGASSWLTSLPLKEYGFLLIVPCTIRDTHPYKGHFT